MSRVATTFRQSRRKPGFVAAMLHRVSGIALAIFLPMHFFALGTALGGADALDSFLSLTHHWSVRVAEWGMVSALSLHMALGLRVLAIEWWSFRASTARALTACCAATFTVGLMFLLSGA